MKFNEFTEITSLADDDILLVQECSTLAIKKLKLSTLKTYLGFVNSNEQRLNYFSDGDTNGVFYWLGSKSNTQLWQNPQTINKASFASSGVNQGALSDLTDRSSSNFFTTDGASNNFVSLDLGAGHSLVCNYYSIQARNVANYYPRSWKLQGCNDNISWANLDEQNNNQSLNNPSSWLSISVTSTIAYRYFRILLASPNSSGSNQLCFGELEFYGTYK